MSQYPDQTVHSGATQSRADEDGLALRHLRLTENSSTVLSSIVGNVINFLCVLAVKISYDVGQVWMLISASAALLALLGWRWHIAMTIRSIDVDNEAMISRAERLTGITALLLGAFWGLAAAMMFATRIPDIGVFAGIIGAGMMSAGAITYRTLPRAALAYILACAFGGLLGLVTLQNQAAYAAMGLLACFIIVLRSNIQSNDARFVDAQQRQRELARSSDTIQLLLNDFTEQGSDWLIEVDRNGRLVDPCDRMAEASQRPMEILAGLPFARLLDDGDARDDLKQHFVSGRIIRRHIVSLTVNGSQRWWSISARPSRTGRIAYRGVVTDITAQRHAEERVSYLAHYDGLTDLPNRFMFNERLYHALNRGSGAVGIMYLDLDHFKSINDTLGHSFGDKLLQGVARSIETVVGTSAMVARLGGDEFAVLVPARRLPAIGKLANRIVRELSQPQSLGDHDVIVGASIGIAIAPDHGTTAEVLLRKADLALYAAKAKGRGQALFFSAEMDEAAQQRRAIEMDLRSALSMQQLRLHYQPLIDSASEETIGYEALIRWEHPARGVVMPNTFIPVAEETGLIVPLGEWVIRQALDDARSWPGHVSIAINLSPLQMRSPTLISTIVGALATTRIDPTRVCLEITESVLMHDTAANIQTLHKLRDLGIQIALDDFGTGYSSLNYLRSFPFSKIKIDRCFIEDIDRRADCQAIVKSVVDLAASLGMSAIAEGVERRDQADALRDQGCSELQGFLYSKALPFDQLTDLRSPERRRA
jgi:diguanylate cyclase (GGDEF)-like protein